MSDKRPVPDYAPPPGPHRSMSEAGCAAAIFGTLSGVAGALVLLYTLFLYAFSSAPQDNPMELTVIFLIGVTLVGASVHWLLASVRAVTGRDRGNGRSRAAGL